MKKTIYKKTKRAIIQIIGTNSIKLYLNMVTVKKTFQMESIFKGEIQNFVKNFNTISFKCTSIEYHNNTGLVSKITFDEIESETL